VKELLYAQAADSQFVMSVGWLYSVRVQAFMSSKPLLIDTFAHFRPRTPAPKRGNVRNSYGSASDASPGVTRTCLKEQFVSDL
jgi:hypothetical protein